MQAVAAAVSTYRLYQGQHPSCLLALENVVEAMEPFFRRGDSVCLELDDEGQGLLLEGDAVTRPPGLALWLTDQLRRRLIKRVVIASQLEPGELSALCALIAAGVHERDADEMRSGLDEARSEHVEIVELEYSDLAGSGAPGKEVLEQEWRLAMGQTAGSVILPFEVEVMVSSLEKLSGVLQKDGATEEVDIISMLAAATAERFGADLPQDNARMELVLTHLLGAIDGQVQQDWQEPSTFQRRQILGMMAQRILNQSPHLISSIAQSAGPMLPQVEARSQGRNPGEVLQHLFMRTPDDEDATPGTSQEAGRSSAAAAWARSATQETRRDPIDPSSLLAKMPDVTPAEGLSAGLDTQEITGELLDVLIRWIVHEEPTSQRECAIDYLHDFIVSEISAPSRLLGREILALLTGDFPGELTPALRKELFSELDCHALLMYLHAALPERRDFVNGGRAAGEVLGEPLLHEAIQCCIGKTATTVTEAFIAGTAQALAAPMACAIARDASDAPQRMVHLALSVADHVDALEQAQLLSTLLRAMGPEAPLSLALRLAGVEGTLATRALREWVAAINHDKRRAFADQLSAEHGTAGMEVIVDIVAGERPWRTMCAQRIMAIRALPGSPSMRARESLARLARFGRWSLSSSKRALARIARETLETMDGRKESPRAGSV